MNAPRMTPEQLRAMYRRRGYTDARIDTLLSQPSATPVSGRPTTLAPGKADPPSGVSSSKKRCDPYASYSEFLFATWLQAETASGRVREWRYESVTLSLGQAKARCRYTPDFFVAMPDGRWFLVEVKGGRVRDDGRVKLLAAQQQWPMMHIIRVDVIRGEITGTEQLGVV